jgi:hypothetical protein
MTIDIMPIERGGRYYVELAMDGRPMNTHGGFATPDEAEVVACRIAAMARGLHAAVHWMEPVASARKR